MSAIEFATVAVWLAAIIILLGWASDGMSRPW